MAEKLRSHALDFAKETQLFLKAYKRLKNGNSGLGGAMAKFGTGVKKTYNRGEINIGPGRSGERKYDYGETSRAQTAGRKNGFYKGKLNRKRTLPLGKKAAATQKETKKPKKRSHSVANAVKGNVAVGGSHPKGMNRTFMFANC